MSSDLMFDSFGLYIMGLVLVFGSYDILLRLLHGQRRRKLGLVLSCIFLALMGGVFLILAILLLAKLYLSSKSLFFTGVVIFVAVAGGTFQLMRWKREIAREDRRSSAAGSENETGADQRGNLREK